MTTQPMPIEEAVEVTAVDAIVAKVGRERRLTIPLLQAVQAHYGYLPRAALVRLCEVADVTPAQVEGVASFYSQFRRLPVGRHLVSVCHGTACHVAGAEGVTDALRRHLGLAGDADTDAEPQFTVQKVACLGCCSLAPVMRIDGRDLRPPDRPSRRPACWSASCAATRTGRPACCRRARGDAATAAWRRSASGSAPAAWPAAAGTCWSGWASELRALGADVSVKCGALRGHVPPRAAGRVRRRRRAARRSYGNVTPGRGRRHRRHAGAADRHAAPGEGRAAPGRRAARPPTPPGSPAADFAIDPQSDPVRAFLDKQVEVVLEGRGEMDPVDIDEYRAHDGFAALERCLREMTPEAVIDTVERAGLRGRGGAGYPDRAQVGAGAPPAGRAEVHRDATATRATPARSWTA